MSSKSNKYKTIPLAIIVFIVLFVHDTNLYPNLSIVHRFILSSLRLLLLAVPVILANFLNLPKSRSVRVAIFVALMLFIPYTLYSVTEVRHIAELCPVDSATYFTDNCSLSSWQLLPPLAYAIIGIAAYGMCLRRLKKHLLNWQLGLLVLYISLATQFALQSRLNIWSIATQPADLVREVAMAVKTWAFWLNSTAFMLLFTAITIAIVGLTNLRAATKPRQPL